MNKGRVSIQVFFCLLMMMLLLISGCGSSSSSSSSSYAVTLSSIAVTPATPSITVAATQQFTATGTYSNGSKADITASVTWSSSDTAIATVVSTSGLATAVAAGTPTITATSGSVSGNTVMTVTAQNLIDVHAHATVSSVSASALDLVNMMTSKGVSTTILVTFPLANYQAVDNSSSGLITFFTAHSSRFRYMYGGSELEPLLFARGYNGTLPITSALVYPNGGDTFTAQNISDFNAIRTEAEGGAWETLFRDRATTAAISGQYVGFGELGALHLSTKARQPYLTYNVDTPWMLWLSDLAADHNMVIDVHVEATATTLTQLAALLSHNTNTKIIWDHAGWTNLEGSLATAAVFSQMLADHANLYLSLKMRAGEEGQSISPVDSDGTIKSDWYTLLTTYADRIMVGTDAKYWDSGATVEEDFESAYSSLNSMLEQLPSATAVQLRYGTAKTLFGL